MRVVISGASGMIGTALRPVLEAGGHTVVGLTRRARPGWIGWDPESGSLDARELEGAGAIIHLAGRNLDTRWTRDARRAMWASRVDAGRLLAAALTQLHHPPAVYVTASAVGYYGDRGDETLDESSAPGRGFLAELCQAWEAAAEPAAQAGVRVVVMRTGVVLENLTSRLAFPFRLGLGARLGHGRQWMSWVLLEDLVRLYGHVIEDPQVSGVVNAVSEPATNADFTRTLAAACRRPAWFTVPAFALRMVFGRDMVDQTLLTSQRVIPARACALGFRFAGGRLAEAIPLALGGGR